MSNPFSISTRSLIASLLLRSIYLSYSLEFFTFLSALKKFYSFFMFYVKVKVKKRNLFKVDVNNASLILPLRVFLKKQLFKKEQYTKWEKYCNRGIVIFRRKSLNKLVIDLGKLTNFEFFYNMKKRLRFGVLIYRLRVVLSFFLLSYKFFLKLIKKGLFDKIKIKKNSFFYKTFNFLWQKNEKGLEYNKEEYIDLLTIRKNLIDYFLREVNFRIKFFLKKRKKKKII